MRDEVSDSINSFSKNKNLIFLTGDLGFNALENLAASMGDRFINAGVSEQNMIGVAAALTRKNFECWAYSIAPFCYARPFEQIRNDICFHNLPVRLVGNGGGYGYGVMGPTHHAIEDYGVLSSLPNIKSFVPAFEEDVASIIKKIRYFRGPTYLRLGVDCSPQNWKPPKYKAWRKLIQGNGVPIVISGPISGSFVEMLLKINPKIRPEMWLVSEFPIKKNPIPEEFIKKVNKLKKLIILEEHTENGGLAQQLVLNLLEKHKVILKKVAHLFAKKHIYDAYGSQNFLRIKSGIDPKSLNKAIRSMR